VLDLTNPSARPVKVSTSAGGNFNPAYSLDGKWLAWRSQSRPGYESDKFRLLIYDRAAKTSKNLLPNFENWVDEFVWESWGDGSQHILFVSRNSTSLWSSARGVERYSLCHLERT
jgi:Tol biopolymer transport system component